jgi:hypothetical protein
MTDATTFYRQLVAQCGVFTQACDQIRLLADRIAADSTLSAAAAAAAQAGGRPDLTTGDFDNFKTATDSIETRLNTNDPSVNAATVKLPFYKLL